MWEIFESIIALLAVEELDNKAGGPSPQVMLHGYLLLNEYIGDTILATIMAHIHNRIADVYIPGLPENTCYLDHVKKGFSQGRDHCIGGFRLLINAILPFLYPNIQEEIDIISNSPAPIVVDQPTKLE